MLEACPAPERLNRAFQTPMQQQQQLQNYKRAAIAVQLDLPIAAATCAMPPALDCSLHLGLKISC
jgi:hypothetical protein